MNSPGLGLESRISKGEGDSAVNQSNVRASSTEARKIVPKKKPTTLGDIE